MPVVLHCSFSSSRHLLCRLFKGEQFRYFKRNEDNKFKHVKRGTLSFVNDGANRHGSQFFVTLGENLDSLDGKHSVFGEVAQESYPVLDKINSVMCDEKNQPYRDIRCEERVHVCLWMYVYVLFCLFIRVCVRVRECVFVFVFVCLCECVSD